LPIWETGLLPFYGDINYEYALPNMKTAGSVVVDGKRYQVDGVSWFDRQWGQMAPSFWAHKQWSWMGISLDNGDRISLWDIIDGDKEHAFATLLHPDGRHEIVDVEPLAQGATSIWTSAASGHRYPTDWVVSIPTLKARLRVEPTAALAGDRPRRRIYSGVIDPEVQPPHRGRGPFSQLSNRMWFRHIGFVRDNSASRAIGHISRCCRRSILVDVSNNDVGSRLC